ncbi:MAG: LOG family protein [Chloroflexi bacterium]|nr:LOG family protein [Chloroflexota bacterium]MBV9899384.1 LOG family protein [Chloroflexota bacterium]
MTAITVFGGSRVEPESDEYAAARELGRALAARGLTVVTGGYNGVMEAVSQGAKEIGGQVIGVTVDVIARNFNRLPNAYLDQEVKTVALLERIDKMVELGAAYVILPGGAGTLAELGVVWNLALLGALHGKPLLVVGNGWRRVLQTMIDELHTIETDLQFLQFVADVPAAVEVLATALT